MSRRPSSLSSAAAVALVFCACGCAIFTETYGIQEVDNWVARNEPLAATGKMKWSDFYARYLEKVAATPVISQGPVVETLGILITASQFYEQGRLSQADFDSVRRIVGTYQSIDDAAANLLARDALVKALERGERPSGRQAGTASP